MQHAGTPTQTLVGVESNRFSKSGPTLRDPYVPSPSQNLSAACSMYLSILLSNGIKMLYFRVVQCEVRKKNGGSRGFLSSLSLPPCGVCRSPVPLVFQYKTTKAKSTKSPQNEVRTHFFATPLLDLEQACMARSACRRVAAL